MRTAYNPFDHYWINEATQEVFSSRRQLRVAYADPDYQAWRALGNTPSRDPGSQELRALLAPYSLGLSPQETSKLQRFVNLTTRPHIAARVLRRLLRLLVTRNVITAAQAQDLLDTSEETDPEA